jgi:predicted O-methyltransferase YrrM
LLSLMSQTRIANEDTTPPSTPLQETNLNELIARARNDAAFADINGRVSQAGIQNWLLDDEKPLLFSIGAFAPGDGVIVEIGSFQGGSAAFLSAGLARRGQGRLYCVDPHLGGPPWLGMAPHQSTLSIFRDKLRICGVDNWVSPIVGESTAVAAVWPAKPIDAVFIDGDHSFRGALKDFESWVPKLRPGGLVILDDADDPVLTELLDFIEFVKGLRAVQHVGTIQGMAVFSYNATDPSNILQQIGRACGKRGIHRPWDYTLLHERALPPTFHRSRSWAPDHGLDIAYQLCFLARCGPGAYGYSSSTRHEDREILYSLSRDRADGEVRVVGSRADRNHKFRAILCAPEEAPQLAPLLMPGGVLVAREQNPDSLAARKLLLQAGLEGCGYDSGMQWGVWKPGYLSADAIIDYAVQAYEI